MAKMNWYDWLAIGLLVIGGINWGLVAFNFNLVEKIFSFMPALVKVVYGLVGFSALYSIYALAKI